jgi:shikimate dehydrogenase
VRFLVLGDPIEHSLSPVIHNAAFRAAGLVGHYARRRVDAGGLAAAFAEIRSGALSGANVTMPHKELAAQLCDRVGRLAARAGAVNTLVRSGGAVVGHNTDVTGIQAAWCEGALPPDGPVIVLGAGGAAAAALLALEGRELFVAARRPGAAAELSSRIGVAADPIEWGSGVAGAVVVNATPLGMKGEQLDSSLIDQAGGLFDMAYAHQPTPTVMEASRRGLPTVEGRRMLLHQAAAAFELWTGRTAPLEAMDDALGM